jgi:hypothetical protein
MEKLKQLGITSMTVTEMSLFIQTIEHLFVTLTFRILFIFFSSFIFCNYVS